MKNLFAAVGLTLSAFAVVVYLAPWTEDATPLQMPEALKSEPDLYMRNARITQFQDNGMLHYQLDSEQILHFEKTSQTQLTQPRLTLHDEDSAPWDIRALTGLIELSSSEGEPEEVVYLNGDVVMATVHTESNITLRSEAMTIFPDRQFVETDRSVTIDADIGQTLAEGMQGDLQLGLLKLFSTSDKRVQTTVLPQNFR